jgi:tight adherence protein C
MLSSPYLLVGIIVLVFGAIGGVAFAVWSFITPERTSSDRLRDMTGGGSANLRNQQRDEAVERIAARLSALANPNDEEERVKLRLMMVQAGYTNRHAYEMYNALRVLLAIGLPLFVVTPMAGSGDMMRIGGGVVISAALGYYLPVFVVNSQVTSRQKKIMRPFSDALDMLVSSVEAGLGLDAAFRRVAEEMEVAAPELAREFQIVNHEIAAGVPRLEALKHLADRTGVEEINALVNMLAQAERFGTSIARSLRVHSSTTRQKRMSRAEEEAAKVSPKLTVVMILFLMPCLMIVLLGPAAVNIKNSVIMKGTQ